MAVKFNDKHLSDFIGANEYANIQPMVNAAHDMLVNKIQTMDTLRLFSFVPFSELLWPMVATFVAAGMFVGILGSWTSIRKFMDV